jgi:hypothetical protein
VTRTQLSDISNYRKYCECFQGSVVCGENCKCTGCQNFTGSRALMERRRKMQSSDKDGSTLLHKPIDKSWRGSLSDSKVPQQQPAGFGQSPIVHDPKRPMMKTPMQHPFVASQPAFQPGPMMMGQSPMNYPYGIMYQTPFSAPNVPRPAVNFSAPTRGEFMGTQQVPVYPHYPIDSTSARKQPRSHKSKASPRKIESRDSFFGPNVEKQTRSAALRVFSYLDNDSLFCASIVSKAWSNLAFDNEL